MKVVSGILLLLLSFNVQASFQDELLFSIITQNGDAEESNGYNLSYLHLFSAEIDQSVPYAEQLFVSKSNRVSVGYSQSTTEVTDDAFSRDFVDVDIGAVEISGIYYFPATSFNIGLGYMSQDYDSRVRVTNSDNYSQFLFAVLDGLTTISGNGYDLSLGYYVTPMSQVRVMLSHAELDWNLFNLGLQAQLSSYAIEYDQLFKVNGTYFSLGVEIVNKKTTVDSAKFGNLGIDSKEMGVLLDFNYYVNKSTSVGVAALYIRSDVSGLDEKVNAQDYLLQSVHYFNPDLSVSIAYAKNESSDSDGYNLVVGYRF